jgi:pimeloyl-ACP methyl ester carboxylesterase
MSDPLPRETGYLERDGERIYWENVGSGDPLVLSHGAGGNHAIWFQQVPVFARHRRVVTWDHRGFGRSSAIGGPTTPALAAADLVALLDHLGIGQTDLVGQSMGGWTALRTALDHPNRVRRLVMSNTPGGIQTAALEEAWKTIGPRPLAGDAAGRVPALAESFSESNLAGAYLYQMLGGFGEPDMGSIAQGLIVSMVARSDLMAISCPVLFTTGDQDALFSPALIRESAGLIPGARFHEFVGAGHSPYFEMPEVWNAVVGEFLGLPT